GRAPCSVDRRQERAASGRHRLRAGDQGQHGAAGDCAVAQMTGLPKPVLPKTVVPPRLRVRALHKRFGPTQALAGVNLEVLAGEVHALVGENGAGKSTLLKALAGVHLADTGAMEIDGMLHLPVDPAEARAAGLAIIHQELALAPHLTIAE